MREAMDSPPSNSWRDIVSAYQKAYPLKATWQFVTTLLGYIGSWALLYWSVQVSWWYTIPLCFLAAGFMIRSFIIAHDCGHGSFYKTAKANDRAGVLMGVLSWSPYYQWRWEHAIHHATSGDLDRRGMGDIWTLTVQEYLESSRWRRFAYRLSRSAFVLFVLAPLFLFFFQFRTVTKGAHRRAKNSVWFTNFCVLGMAIGLGSLFGYFNYFIIQLTVIVIAGSVGVWLFYVQHQFEGVYWGRGESWDYTQAALKGSSYFKLPKILQWFTGNIGFHHIHHLSPRIPNYNLEACHKAETIFQEVPTISLWKSFKSLRHHLWDETNEKLVSYGAVKRQVREKMKANSMDSHLG